MHLALPGADILFRRHRHACSRGAVNRETKVSVDGVADGGQSPVLHIAPLPPVWLAHHVLYQPGAIALRR